MKIQVSTTCEHGYQFEHTYDVDFVHTAKAQEFLTPDEIADNGTRPDEIWTRLYLMDGGTATFRAAGIILDVNPARA